MQYRALSTFLPTNGHKLRRVGGYNPPIIKTSQCNTLDRLKFAQCKVMSLYPSCFCFTKFFCHFLCMTTLFSCYISILGNTPKSLVSNELASGLVTGQSHKVSVAFMFILWMEASSSHKIQFNSNQLYRDFNSSHCHKVLYI